MKKILYSLLFLFESTNCIASQNEVGLKYQGYLGGVYRMYENEKPIHIFYNHHFNEFFGIGASFGNRPTGKFSFNNYNTSLKQKSIQVYGTGYFPLSQRFVPYFSLGLGEAYYEVKDAYHDGHTEMDSGFTHPGLIAEFGSIYNVTHNINARISLGGHHLFYEKDGESYGSIGANLAIGISYIF
ncbi:porin family protein [Vibrio sp. JC009]|uniref:outer membrane protein n=1 Tax=Vibrio sp. JC009 TaxID=2912314 RepID=UPI0023AFD674|nr:outer membrane beta-barrel protein [Vibrio sp. JC009]WED22355.1 porin family protein [Vibrio sp. JC009]